MPRLPMAGLRIVLAAAALSIAAVLFPFAAHSAQPPQAWRSALVEMNEEPTALAGVCARVAAGESVNDVVYDCSGFSAFQADCTDPERSTEDCLTLPTTATECWDCTGSAMTEAQRLAAACSPAVLAANPQHLDLCFPEKWAWVCFSADPARNITEHCEMYRRDLDPLGVFATPTPIPTPEPLPTTVPTATPDPTPDPDPGSSATPTP